MRTKQITIFAMLIAAFICTTGSPGFAAEISGTVELDDGTPVTGVSVRVYTPDMANMGSVVTGVLPPGSFSVKSLKEGQWLTGQWKIYADPLDKSEYKEYMRSDIKSADLLSVDQKLIIGTLVLKKMNVRGRVILPDSSPVNNAEVQVYDDNGNLADSDMYFYTGADGYFKLNLNPGEYEIQVHPPGDAAFAQYGSVRDKPFEVKDTGLFEVGDITLPLWVKKITGTLTYDKESISGATIMADNWDSKFFRSVTTNSNGEFEIWVDKGKWEVSVCQQNNVEWIIPDPQGVQFSMDSGSETETLEIDLLPAEGYMTGRILDPTGGTLNFGGLSIQAYNQEKEDIYSIPPDNTGSFKLPLFAGRYEISVWVDPRVYPDHARTELPLVNITEGATVKLGDIKLTKRDASIRGSVKGLTGEAVSNAIVDVFDSDGNWFSTRTDSNGDYDISVTSGAWTVEPWDESYAYVFTSPSKPAMLTEVINTAAVTFDMEKAEGAIDGIIEDQEGNKLTDIRPRVYMRRENTQPLIYEDTENGEFMLNVLPGDVYIGAELPPNTGYTFIKEVQYTSGPEPTEPVVITLDKNDSVIRGTFLDPSGNTVTGIGGRLSASLVGDINAWQQSNINPDDGTFEIKVSAGKWNLTFFLDTGDYISRATESLEVIVEEGGTVTKDITLIPLDGIVKGYVLAPDGKTRVPNTQVWLRNFRDEILIYHARAFTNSQGEFRFKAPMEDIAEGSNVFVGTAVNTTDTEYSETSARRDTYTYRSSSYGGSYASYPKKKRSPENVVLTLRDADIFMEGKVLDSSGSPVDGAFVSAYSEDSQTIQGNTNSEGVYQLFIAQAETHAGNTWSVSAAYREKGDTTYYRSEETVVNTCGSDDVYAVPDLTVQASGVFPPAITRRFMVKNSWTLTLDNGFHMEIPAHTIPSREETVLVTIEPIVDRLPHNSQNRLVHHGYDIKLIEKDTGKEIFDKFRNDVVISVRYTDEQLEELGVEESEIYPARFSELSHMWYPELNFFVDEANNKITFRTRHLSLWALVTSEPVETVPEPEIDIKGNNTSIADNSTTPLASDHTDFGSTSVNRTVERTFTIHNLGTAELIIGDITFSGTHASDFSVVTQPDTTVAPEATSTFTVKFAPGKEGEKNAEISIVNNDCGERTYNFAIQGTGVSSAPEMDVKGNNTSIADNDTTPSVSDHTDFGEAAVPGGTVAHTFAILNTGDGDLTIGNITFSGTHPRDFSVTSPPDSPVSPGKETTFTVTFDPMGKGTRTAEISIVNDDGNENPYNFVIRGTGTPFGDVNGDDDINLKDLIVVLKILAGIDVSFANPGSDISGDGKFELEDAVYILQMIAEQRP